MGIDLDRGVMTRFHPSGFKVSMYIGDAAGNGADPGTYFDENGVTVDMKLAKAAGFDVEADIRNKIKLQRLADFRAQVEVEFKSEEDKLADALTHTGKYDVRHIGAGQYAIFDKKGADGKRLTRVGMTKADVEVLIGKEVATDPNDPLAADLNTLLGATQGAQSN